MTNIQNKTLQHISETLNAFDSYKLYRALVDAMTEQGIEYSVRSKIAEKIQVVISEQSKKVSDAKEWVNALISDAQ